jgi:sarcosine oxidase subunit gamma
MAERHLDLAHLSAHAGSAAVTLSQIHAGSILQIQAWPDTLETVRQVIAEMAGIEAPGLGRAATSAGTTIAAIAPGRFVLSADSDELASKFEAALPASDAAVTDTSHGRVILRLDGEAAAKVLATSVAIDLDAAAFPPGRVAQTMIHHVDVVLHRRSETQFDLWVLRSFAESLAEWLLDQQLGVGIGFTRPA